MSKHFGNISRKTDELVEKQRRSIADNKAKLKLKANAVLGTNASTKTKKSKPVSKVQQGMYVLCALISVAVTVLIINLNVWPFSLINGGDRALKFSEQLVLFFGIGITLFLIAIYIARPIIKRLEDKYGKQAW